MDAIRSRLGERRLNYFGNSYGTVYVLRWTVARVGDDRSWPALTAGLAQAAGGDTSAMTPRPGPPRPNGNLDAMGLAHLLAIPGHVPEIAGVGETVALVDGTRCRLLRAHPASG